MEELQHHGVKGQRWGVLRYQNKDGSLTALGRARAKAIKKKRIKGLEKARKAKAEAKANKESVEEKKKRILESRSPKELYDNANLFTNDELSRAYNRLQTERNISSLIPKEVSKGERFVESLNKTGKTVAGLLDTGTNLYEKVNKINKMFVKEDKLSITDYLNKDLSKISDNELEKINKRLKSETTYNTLLKNVSNKDAYGKSTTKTDKLIRDIKDLTDDDVNDMIKRLENEEKLKKLLSGK